MRTASAGIVATGLKAARTGSVAKPRWRETALETATPRQSSPTRCAPLEPTTATDPRQDPPSTHSYPLTPPDRRPDYAARPSDRTFAAPPRLRHRARSAPCPRLLFPFPSASQHLCVRLLIAVRTQKPSLFSVKRKGCAIVCCIFDSRTNGQGRT